MININNNLDSEIEAVFAKHFPDETPLEVLSRMQKSIDFAKSIDKKILTYNNKSHTPGASEKQHINGHQPVMLHHFNQTNKKAIHFAPSSAPKLEEEVRAVLLSQVSKLQEINHLEPAQRTSATRRMK